MARCWRCAAAGRSRLVAVSARPQAQERGIDLSGVRWETDPLALADDPDIDVVVELIGGADGVGARRWCEAALARAASMWSPPTRRCSRITARRSPRWPRSRASRSPSRRRWPAASRSSRRCARAWPATASSALYGILNGTCNYILTTMRETGREFADVLAEAQKLGYAEADPELRRRRHRRRAQARDPDQRRLRLPRSISPASMSRASATSPSMDIAVRRGARLPHQAAGHRARRPSYGIEQRVHPCMVPLGAPIAHVEGVFNAVVVEGDFVGQTMFRGPRRRGRGRPPRPWSPTSSTSRAAVTCRPSSCRRRSSPTMPVSPMERHRGAYYIRLMVVDRPGVIADVAAALARRARLAGIDAAARPRAADEAVPVVLTTHETEEARDAPRAWRGSPSLKAVVEQPLHDPDRDAVILGDGASSDADGGSDGRHGQDGSQSRAGGGAGHRGGGACGLAS